MNTATIIRCFVFAIGLIGLLAITPVLAAEKWLEDYADFVKSQALKYRVPGYAFVFYQQGKTPQIFVYGKTHKTGNKINADTRFRLASVSKTFTGVLIAKLARQQAFSLDTRVETLLPDLDFTGKGMNALELQHIIGQSSGFMPNAYDNLIEADYSLGRVLNQLSSLEPLCAPGKCYTYQNALFGAIEAYFNNQNTSYHRQLQEQLFVPLGMKDASAGKGALIAKGNWARPHIAIARNKWREGKIESNYYRFSPAAGVNASIKDMTIWLQAMLGEFPTVVPDAIIEQVTTPRVKTTKEIYRRGWRRHLFDAHYGLGWRIYDFEGETLIYHGGWVKGYRADVAFIPSLGAGYVMLMNAESNMINSTTARLWDTYLEQQKER